MTKQDYKNFAEVIRQARNLYLVTGQATLSLQWIEDRMCEILKKDNDRFDPDKFRDACELNK